MIQHFVYVFQTGEIECTPMNIKGDVTPFVRSDMTPQTHFRIPNVSQREKYGEELANRILTKRKKEKHQSKVHTGGGGIYQSSFERLNLMSPAAQMLATKKLGLNSIDRSLQASYSPNVSSFRSHTLTPRKIITPSPIVKSTPGISTKTIVSPSAIIRKTNTYHEHSSSIKRSKASEFF